MPIGERKTGGTAIHRDSGWKQKVVMQRDAVTRYTRERGESVLLSLPPFSRAAREKRISLRPALTECAFFVCFRIRRDHRVMSGLRWQGIRFSLWSSLLRGMQGEYRQDQLSITQQSDSFGYRLSEVLRYNPLSRFLNRTLTESNLVWAIGSAVCFRAKRFRYVNSFQFCREKT